VSTTLNWSCFADALCNTFKIYRAITGITVAFPNTIQVGDKLLLSVSKGTPQTITMSGATTTSLASDILSQGKGITATINQANTAVLIRAAASEYPRFQLLACSFATHTSQTPRVVLPRQEFTLITSVARTAGIFDYSFVDLDGVPADWYRMTTVTDSVETIPTLDSHALLSPQSFCVIVGRVMDGQNRPIVGAPVTAALQADSRHTDNSGIVGTVFEAQTDLYGRFAIPLLQGQVVLLQIKSIGYNQFVQIPDQPYVLFSDLVVVCPPSADFDNVGGIESPCNRPC